MLEKIREDMVGGPRIVITRNTLVDERLLSASQRICASQLTA